MDALEHARLIRQEADGVLAVTRLVEIIRPYARIVPTGSYFLDVMVYPDIDLMISLVSLPQLFHIGAQLADCEQVFQVVFEKSGDPDLPGGLYLKPRIRYGTWGRPWKIDIWSLAEDVVERKMAQMRRFQAMMTPAIREKIIRYKLSILTRDGRTPMYSGYFIYKAFFDEGLVEPEAVTGYLRSNGITIEA